MNRWYTEREQFDMLVDLVKTLNMGNTCSPDDRVRLAKAQFKELSTAIQEIRDSNNPLRKN